MRARLTSALVAGLALSALAAGASCDAVVGVDWDAYERAEGEPDDDGTTGGTPDDPLPAAPCDDTCFTTAAVIADGAALVVRGATVTSDGGVVVVGSFTGASSVLGVEASAFASAFALKLCADGKVAWSASWRGDTGSAIARGVAGDDAGGVWIAGEFAGTFDVGAPPVTEVDAAGTARGFVAHVDVGGIVDRAVELAAPASDVAWSALSPTAPLAVTMLTPVGVAPFPSSACAGDAPPEGTAMDVLRMSETAACLDRTRCSRTTAVDREAMASDLAFTGDGALLFASEYSADQEPLVTCGDGADVSPGERGFVLARASTRAGFDQDFAPPHAAGYEPAGPLFVGEDPTTLGVIVSGTTSAPFDVIGVVNAPRPSMFVLAFVAEGNPNKEITVGPETTGSSLGGALWFSEDGTVSTAATVSGTVVWGTDGQEHTSAPAGRQLLVSRLGIEQEVPFTSQALDPSSSRAFVPLVAARPGCSPVLVTSFEGAVGLASGTKTADGAGADILIAPGPGEGFFAE